MTKKELIGQIYDLEKILNIVKYSTREQYIKNRLRLFKEDKTQLQNRLNDLQNRLLNQEGQTCIK